MLLLTGMTYAGKTTLGKMLAKEYNTTSKDFADIFIDRYGITENEYLIKEGRDIFAEAERKILIDIIDGVIDCDIVSLSGSSMYHINEMEKLAGNNKNNILFIDVPFLVIENRRDTDPNRSSRPIVYPDGITSFSELYQQRYLLYLKYHSSKVIVNEQDTPEDVLEHINTILASYPL